MTITVDELMRNAYVLTVNQARLAAFLNRWDAYGLTRPKPFWGYHFHKGFYSGGLRIEHNTANCAFSHYALVKMAEALDLPFIFILEDDALPCLHIHEKLSSVLSDLPDDLNALRLGSFTGDTQGWSSDVGNKLTARASMGSHAYIVFRRYYKEYERIFNNHNCIPDVLLINYQRAAHGPDCHLFASVENLFIQKDPEILDYQALHQNDQARKNTLQRRMPNGPDFDYVTAACTHKLPFDAIYVVSCRKTQKRIPRVLHQLKTLGFSDSVPVHVRYAPSSVSLKEFFLQHIQMDHPYSAGHPYVFWCTFGHYLVYHEALDRGYDRILVLEDDIHFMRDIDRLKKALITLPDTADLVNLEWHPHTRDESYYKSGLFENYIYRHRYETWVPYDRHPDFMLRGSAGYIVSCKAIKSLINLHDGYMTNKENKFISVDQVFAPSVAAKYDLACYFSLPVLGIQKNEADDPGNPKDLNNYRGIHRSIEGFSTDQYNWDFSSLEG